MYIQVFYKVVMIQKQRYHFTALTMLYYVISKKFNYQASCVLLYYLLVLHLVDGEDL